MTALTDDEIYDALFGGRHDGLADRIHKRIRDGASTVDDLLELHDRVCDWLGIDPGSDVRSRDVHIVVTRANSRAGRWLKMKRAGDRRRQQARDLIGLYTGWIRSTCQHARVPSWGPPADCPDCGATIVNLGGVPGKPRNEAPR